MRLLPLVVCLSGIGMAASDPCRLLTSAEIQEIAGATVAEGAPNKGNKQVCDYKVGSTGAIVGVMLTPKAAADTAERTVAELKKRKVNADVVPGIGDGAYASAGFAMQQAGAYKGSNHVIVTMFMFQGPEQKLKAMAQALLKKALTRIQ